MAVVQSQPQINPLVVHAVLTDMLTAGTIIYNPFLFGLFFVHPQTCTDYHFGAIKEDTKSQPPTRQRNKRRPPQTEIGNMEGVYLG